MAVVISLIVGVIFGSQFNANWSEILLMFNAQSFGTTDPQFGLGQRLLRVRAAGLKLVLAAVAMLLGVGLVFSVVTHVLMVVSALLCRLTDAACSPSPSVAVASLASG